MSQDSVLANYESQVMIKGKIYIKSDVEYKGSGVVDADTINLNIYEDSVSFRPNVEEEWNDNLTVLNDCYIYDEEEKKPVSVVERKPSFSFIRVRLQGIDAPELHYPPIQNDIQLTTEQQEKFDEEAKKSYRQRWGANATNELFKELRKYFLPPENGKIFVDAYMLSRVNKPSELFDKFGRAIGDIYVSKTNLNLNKWLVERGWAFPDFYNSMSLSEIQELKKLGDTATRPMVGIRNDYSKQLVPFESLIHKRDEEIDLEKDKGKLNLPKFFRKQVDYEILKKCGMSSTTLKAFVNNMERDCYKTDEVLQPGNSNPKIYPLSEFLDNNDNITISPGDLIYHESPAQLLDKNGQILERDEWY